MPLQMFKHGNYINKVNSISCIYATYSRYKIVTRDTYKKVD